ncbi:MAG: ABC transporter permease [Acidobacteriota bacterium]
MWRKRDESLQRELEDYLENETALNIARGMPPEDARAASRRKLGNTGKIQEDTRTIWGWVWLECLLQDIRHAARMFAKNPGFTAIAIISIALGTGANVGSFSGADAMLLRPLAIDRPDELYTVGSRVTYDQFSRLSASYRDFVDIRTRSRSFSDLVAHRELTVGFAPRREDQPKIKMGALVTDRFFETVGVPMLLGRTFRAHENSVPGGAAVMILSHEMWTSDFRNDPHVIGRVVWLNRIPFTIVGVAPQGFIGMDIIVRTSFFAPAMMWPRLSPGATPLDDRRMRWMTMQARLKDGVSLAAARAEIAAISDNLRAEYPDENRETNFRMQTEFEARALRSPGNAGMSAMALALSMTVLLVACANLAGLLMSRAPVRAREIALRLAVGAGRGRLLRQIVTENLMIAVTGALLGVALGSVLVQRLQTITFPTDLPLGIEIRMDERTLLFSLAVAIGCVFIFGLAPAWEMLRGNLTTALKSASNDERRQRVWGRNGLVVAQVALALGMLTVAVLLHQNFKQEYAHGPGYRTDHLFLASFDTSLVNRSPQQSQRFFDDLLDRVRRMPGVRSASLTTRIPLSLTFSDGLGLFPEGHAFETPRFHFGARIDEDYFDTMALPVIQGRAFRRQDGADAPLVAIVNRAFVNHYWPGANPIGKRFRRDAIDGPWVEIVGVTPTTKYLWPGEGPVEYVYFPRRQTPASQMTLATQSYGDPALLETPLRALIRELDPEVPVFDVMTISSLYNARVLVAGGMANDLVAMMGIIGMGLSMIGLYGLVSYSVARRTREFGIRVAVGATARSIERLVIGQGARLATAGVALGLAVSYAGGRALAAIFPTSGHVGAAAYGWVALVFVGIVLIAAWIPARRASRVDPNVALRQE